MTYEDTSRAETKRDVPRVRVELDSLEMTIEKTRSLADTLHERLASVMVSQTEKTTDRTAESVPMREPSSVARSVIDARARVQDIQNLISDVLTRLEI